MNPFTTPDTRPPTRPTSAALGRPGLPPPVAERSRQAAVKAGVITIAPLVLALAVLGGAGSFTTVRAMARPWFGDLAWIVPIGMDVGIFILLAWDLLMEYVALPWPVLRWVAWTFITGTVAVNVLAAGGDPAGIVIHAAMPVLFITVIEGVRHLIRQWVGLTTGTRLERIPATRWLLAPLSTGLLWRRMVLWHVTSYRDALDLHHRHLLAVSRLQQDHGRWAWRWRAPLAERIALRHLPTGTAQPPAHESSPTRKDEGASGREPGTPHIHAGTDQIDDELLLATRQILTDADRQGVRLSHANLGRRLRALGFTIANERLADLRAAAEGQGATTAQAETDAPPERPDEPNPPETRS